MIAVDASVIVAHLDKRDTHHLRAVHLLLEHAELELVVSPITLAEILVGTAR